MQKCFYAGCAQTIACIGAALGALGVILGALSFIKRK
jgi:hypothetical protein